MLRGWLSFFEKRFRAKEYGGPDADGAVADMRTNMLFSP